jgi:hypothetical protein
VKISHKYIIKENNKKKVKEKKRKIGIIVPHAQECKSLNTGVSFVLMHT